jgi:hypothetical protein
LFSIVCTRSSAGQWIEIENLPESRRGHTATLLPNGEVLVAGGYTLRTFNSVISTNKCFIYNTTKGWREVSPMKNPKVYHKSHLLNNGKVIVIGSDDKSEIYNYLENEWESLVLPSIIQSSCLLADGRLFAIGAECYIYNPTANLWSTVSPIPFSGGVNNSLTLLDDGRIMYAGGKLGSESNQCCIYDPVLDKWSIVAPMITARYNHSAISVNENHLLIVGGRKVESTANLKSCELYDIKNNTWQNVGVMNFAHGFTELFKDNTGKVYIAGGKASTISANNYFESYDEINKKWDLVENLKSKRSEHAVVVLQNGNIFVTGGETEEDTLPSSKCEKYITNESIQVIGSPSGVHSYIGGDARFEVFAKGNNVKYQWQKNKVDIFGANDDHIQINNIKQSDQGEYRVLCSNEYGYEYSNFAILNIEENINITKDGRTLAWGYRSSTQTPEDHAYFKNNGKIFTAGNTNKIESYDIASNTWEVLSYNLPKFGSGTIWSGSQYNMVSYYPVENSIHISNLQHSTKFYINSKSWSPISIHYRGFSSSQPILLDNGSYFYANISNSWIYDPEKDIFYPNSNFDDRNYHSGIKLLDGRVLISGGKMSNNILSSCQIYDPVNDKYIYTGSMNNRRMQHTSTLLPNGNVLVAGGEDGGGTSTIELYDVKRGKWDIVGILKKYRKNHSSSIIEGTHYVIFSGGESFGGITYSDCEIFDLENRKSFSYYPMGANRKSHSMCKLDDGSILAIGGGSSEILSYMKSAKILGQISSATINEGSFHSFRIDFEGDDVKFEWLKDQAVVGNGDTLNIVGADESMEGSYSVRIYNSFSVSESNQVHLEVISKPRILKNISSIDSLIGSSATLQLSATGDQLSYQWYKNGSPISGATGVSYTIPSAQASDAGNYTVSVKNSAKSVTSAVAKLTVNAPKVTSNLAAVTLKQGKLMNRYTVTTNFGAKSFSAKNLPAGLKLDATTGVVSGKPTKKGTFTVTFTAAKKQGTKVIQSATGKKVFKVN